MMAATPDLLDAIVAATRARVREAMRREPSSRLEARAARATPDGAGFLRALSATDRVNVIAECKRRSPSRGVLRAAYDPVEIARSYGAAGAAAVSVLTEPMFFDGTLEHLAAVRRAVTVPLLRKDFIVDPYQLLEARAVGADAVLLIVAALSDEALQALVSGARALGLAALAEVHAEDEILRALAAGAGIIGVNNRNLRTLAVDVDLSSRLAPLIPPGAIAVSESGLRTPADIEALRRAGYRAFLMGERFMTARDPGAALSALLSEAAP